MEKFIKFNNRIVNTHYIKTINKDYSFVHDPYVIKMELAEEDTIYEIYKSQEELDGAFNRLFEMLK